MNDNMNQQILTELRTLRKINQAMAIVSTVALLTLLAFYLWFRFHSYPSLAASTRNQGDTWESVRSAMDHFEYDRASGIAQRIVQKNPNDYYGYAYLGNIALATGKIKDAENYYAHTVELLPSEQNEKMLEAIRKRLTRENAVQPTATPK